MKSAFNYILHKISPKSTLLIALVMTALWAFMYAAHPAHGKLVAKAITKESYSKPSKQHVNKEATSGNVQFEVDEERETASNSIQSNYNVVQNHSISCLLGTSFCSFVRPVIKKCYHPALFLLLMTFRI